MKSKNRSDCTLFRAFDGANQQQQAGEVFTQVNMTRLHTRLMKRGYARVDFGRSFRRIAMSPDPPDV